MQLGAYTLIKKIAEGGVADIYLAKARTAAKADKYLICKCLKKSLTEDTDFLKSILTEIQCTMKIRHPNVLEIFDLCACEGQSFLTMEYLDAQDFHKLLKKNADTGEAMPIPMAIYAIGQAALGLHAAHELTDNKGNPVHLVHRDVSPENILFGWNGDIKMADFGIAKISTMVDDTPPDLIKGKFNYMSPEHAWGDKLDRRSDIFSLAIVMYEAVLNRIFYGGDSVSDIVSSARMAVFKAPHEIQDDFPPALEAILLKALDLDKKQRYATALEFKMALDAFAKDQGMEVTSQDWIEYLKTRLSCPETRLPLMKAGEMTVDAHSILKPEMMVLEAGGADFDVTGQLSKESIDKIVAQAANTRTGLFPVSELKKLASMPSIPPIPCDPKTRPTIPCEPKTRPTIPCEPKTHPPIPCEPKTLPPIACEPKTLPPISPLEETLKPASIEAFFEKTTEANLDELSKAIHEANNDLTPQTADENSETPELSDASITPAPQDTPDASQTPENHTRHTTLFVAIGVAIVVLVSLLIWAILR